MPKKDLFTKQFHEVTLTKLNIFESYAEAWIPTFVMQPKITEIHIYDFFAGAGYDKNGIPGSPIRLLQKVKSHIKIIQEKKVKIHLHLNEIDKNKFAELSLSCQSFLKENSIISEWTHIHFYNLDFDICFKELYTTIKNFPSLVYLDQNGIKYFRLDFIQKLENSGQTDFLYFLSSSYFRRFGSTNEFQKHLKIDLEEIKKYPYKFIHKTLLEALRMQLSPSSKLMLYPFTLMKGKNIYGIIFGASHPRAVDKFLNIAWDKDKLSGEANFDIHNDIEKTEQSQLIGLGTNYKTKKEIFSEKIEEEILKGKIQNNKDAYDYALKEGHLGSHAADTIKKLKKDKTIDFEGIAPLVNYENVYKKAKLIAFRVVQK